MRRWKRVVTTGVLLLGAASLHAAPVSATGPTGCALGSDAADPAIPGGVDVTGAWVDSYDQGGATHIRATIAVRSLPLTPPPLTAAAVWTVDFRDNLNQQPGVVTHPYLQVTQDPLGNMTGLMGFVRSGQPVPFQNAAVTVTPGSPGYITIERDANTLGIGKDMPLTDFLITSQLVGAETTTVDSAGPFDAAYLANTASHTCVDVALPAQPTALRAADFLDSIGVNTHLNFAGFQDTPTRTGTYAALENALLDLGIKHIRETWSGGQAVKDALIHMGSLGIGINTVFYDLQNPSVADAVEYVATLPGVEAVEGDNEPHANDANIAVAKQFQKDLYPALKADPRTAHLPVGTPAVNLSNPQAYDMLGDLSAYADWGSLHSYSWAEPYSRRLVLDALIEQQRKVSANLPQWVTEAGWDSYLSGAYRGTVDAPEIDYCNTCVSERAQAAYMPKMLLTNFAAGIERSYMYELIDEGYLAPPTTEDYYGLIRMDFSPKPVYHRLKTMNRLLSDSGTLASPGSLTHSVSTPAMQHLLLQKSDGSFWLALWKDERLYETSPFEDPVGPHELTPAGTSVTVTFGQSVTASEYQLKQGTTAVASHGTSTAVTVTVPADDVTLLKLTT